jgi:hypothetical protein
MRSGLHFNVSAGLYGGRAEDCGDTGGVLRGNQTLFACDVKDAKYSSAGCVKSNTLVVNLDKYLAHGFHALRDSDEENSLSKA